MALRNWTEHESDLVFQDGGINWVWGALAPGCRGSAGPSPVGAYNSHADAARSWTCAECIDSRACRAAAHNYTRSVEVQRGRQRRPAQENPGLPRFERRFPRGAEGERGGDTCEEGRQGECGAGPGG